MSLKVTMIAHTRFMGKAARESVNYAWAPADTDDDASALVEFAGRACYKSWDRPNPATATNEGYLEHILNVQHYSVLRHGSVTFHIEGVSRSLTHELVRHVHLAPSQLSQRFVAVRADSFQELVTSWVLPPLFQEDALAMEILSAAWLDAVDAYDKLIQLGEKICADRGYTGTLARKRAREAARAVLPNMTPTAIVLTGNHQAWREMLVKRCAFAADAEIRVLAGELFKQLELLEPNIYQDMILKQDADGYPFLVNKAESARVLSEEN